MTQTELVRLREATDRAIRAVVNSPQPISGAINWVGLSCPEAQWVTTDQGDA